nr:uncharacterized protein LOC109168281 [Ipomoea trifida]
MMNSGFLDFAVNIPKLEQFERVGFRRWQKKIKFLLAALNVAYVLSTPKPVEQENGTLEATRRRLKWENDDLACRGHILNGMSDTLFDIYQYKESSKDLWDVVEAKYISEDASSKKFQVSEFNEFKMVDNRSVMEQFYEIVRILGQIRQHGMNMDDSIAIASIIDKLPPSWKKVHRALMQRKEELTIEQLGSHLYVEEGIRQKESKNKSGARVTGASGSTINFVDEGKPYGNRKGKWKPGKVTKTSKFKKNGKGKVMASVRCWVCNGPHLKKDCDVWKIRKAQMEGKSSGDLGQSEDSWWVDTGATRHVCKDINLYKVYKSLEDGPSLTPKPVEQENGTLEATRRRLKWENDDLACRGHILNGMSDTLFDIYQYEESSKDLWDVVEAKYISEDASSKKFQVSEFNEFKMVDNRSVMEQFYEIVRILGQIRQHGMNMDDSIAIASIIDKLPPSWKKVHRALMQRKEELTIEQLGSHLYVEEGIRQKESKNKSGARVTGASGSTINFVDEGKPYGNRKGKWKPGKVTKTSKFKKNGKGKVMASVRCWVCNGPHLKKDCDVWKIRKAQMEGKSSGDLGQTRGGLTLGQPDMSAKI